jgi:hypothetical protein
LIVLIALAVICGALYFTLNGTGPIRKRESGPFVWRGGRRVLTDDAARELTRRRIEHFGPPTHDDSPQ